MVFMLCYLDGELVTALGTTTSEHGTAALGGHTSTEAVALGALPLIRLIRTLHRFLLSDTDHCISSQALRL